MIALKREKYMRVRTSQRALNLLITYRERTLRLVCFLFDEFLFHVTSTNHAHIFLVFYRCTFSVFSIPSVDLLLSDLGVGTVFFIPSSYVPKLGMRNVFFTFWKTKENCAMISIIFMHKKHSLYV